MAAQAEEPISAHIDSPHRSAAHLPEHVAAPIGAQAAAEALKNGPRGALLISAVAVGLLFIGWLAFYFLLFCREVPLADEPSNPLQRPLPGGIVPKTRSIAPRTVGSSSCSGCSP